jgi:hypothetical protein
MVQLSRSNRIRLDLPLSLLSLFFPAISLQHDIVFDSVELALTG